ncbi:hypothetical protein MNBD_GAMMA05-1746 [hydrothermal vent metagenome]|uniref:Uncharacterized protein n=1 Tax=hydrothermal vent metagenome TaxID=652676 RepID=A0A3B0WHB1_9ZZZZ
MFNPYKKNSDVLEKFRIKAHLRSYVKDPIIIDEKLLLAAVYKLKKLPYKVKDPTDSIAMELVANAYCLGYFRYEDLTETGCRLVLHGKYHGYHVERKDRIHSGNFIKQRFILKTI